MNYKFYTMRRFDSDCFVFEFDNNEFRLDVSIGTRNKLEKLSSIDGEPNFNEKVVAKINGGFFSMGTTHEYIGSYVDEGLYYQGAHEYYPTMIYWKDTKKLTFEHNPPQNRHAIYQRDAYFAIGVPWTLVVNGIADYTYDRETLIKVFSHPYTLQPRTMIGQKEDGTILFVVVDGRTKKSKGINIEQSSTLMLELGCVTAANLDGGGSSEMIVGEAIVNHLSDGSERSIGTAFLCYGKKEMEDIIPEIEYKRIGIVYNLIDGDTLNVRTGPSTKHGKITALNPDTVVEILATNISGKWYRIKCGDISGWVSKNYIKEATGTTSSNCTPLVYMDEIPKGRKVILKEVCGAFYKVELDGTDCLISKTSVSINI